jgi:hypothetical protein
MSKSRLSVAALLGIGIALGYGQPLAFSQSSAPVQPAVPVKEIHVDRKCKILQDESDALSALQKPNCKMTTLSATLRAY